VRSGRSGSGNGEIVGSRPRSSRQGTLPTFSCGSTPLLKICSIPCFRRNGLRHANRPRPSLHGYGATGPALATGSDGPPATAPPTHSPTRKDTAGPDDPAASSPSAPNRAVAPTSAPSAQSDQACFPACRAGFACSDGHCVSACNPPCPAAEKCTPRGECVLKRSAAPAP
jgi:hypothetical protein